MGDLKNKVRFSSTLPTELQQKLKDYSKKSMIPVSKIIETALNEYLTKKQSAEK